MLGRKGEAESGEEIKTKQIQKTLINMHALTAECYIAKSMCAPEPASYTHMSTVKH